MKRRYLLKYLGRHGCVVVREGRRHTIVNNPANGAESQVPRHPAGEGEDWPRFANHIGVEWQDSPRDKSFPNLVFGLLTVSKVPEARFRYLLDSKLGDNVR